MTNQKVALSITHKVRFLMPISFLLHEFVNTEGVLGVILHQLSRMMMHGVSHLLVHSWSDRLSNLFLRDHKALSPSHDIFARGSCELNHVIVGKY